MPKRVKTIWATRLIGLLLLLAAAHPVAAQQLTLGNNLLYDTWLTPNLRVGCRLGPHWSAGLTGGYRPWPTDDNTSRKWKHFLVSPDLRFWTDSVNVHHFFGINAIYSHYNVADVKFPFGLWKAVRHERRQGDLYALGAFYGYSWPLGNHWNLEAFIGAALGYTRFESFKCGHCGDRLGKHNKLFVLPQAGLSLVYTLPGRKRPVVPVVLPPEPDTIVVPVVEKPFIPVLSTVPDFAGRAGELREQNPVLAHISEYRPYDRTRILRKEKDALYVHFPLNSAVLKADFRNNEAVLSRILDVTRQIMADTTSSVCKIQIVGLASIEGAIAANEKLAQNRALALQGYMQQHIAIADSMFDTTGGGEAWAEFRDQLNDALADASLSEATRQSLQAAADIVDTESDLNRREQQLKRLNGGSTWRYLKENILSDQRNSGYIRIYYDYVPDKAAAIINEASELLNTDCGECHAKALSLLRQVEGDKRAENALGVALYLCGYREEAIAHFKNAAADGNKDAEKNLLRVKLR